MERHAELARADVAWLDAFYAAHKAAGGTADAAATASPTS